MPRKKIKNNKSSQLQKIAARLIEISFKADDYIYKKKSISVEHAKKYLEEVEKFVPKCHGDVRSMQVIEKLSHLMKTIIEQGKTNQDGVSQSSYNAFNITSSCTSTLDNTIKSTRSIQVQTNENNELQKNVDNLDKDTSNNQNKSKNIEQTTKVNETDVEIDLERTLSNLSLSIINPDNNEQFLNIKGPVDLHCQVTQKDDNFILPEDSSVPLRSFAVQEKESNTVTGTSILDQALKDQTQPCTDDDKRQDDTTSKTIPDNYITIDLDNYKCQNSAINNIPSNNVTLEQYHGNKAKGKITNKNTKRDVKNKKNNVAKHKDANKPPKDSKATNSTKKLKPKQTRRKKITNPNTTLTVDVAAVTENQQKHTKDNVCDLSWIEKIKFVRIIEPSEYDSSLHLQESFWDNCYLPYDFSQYF